MRIIFKILFDNSNVSRDSFHADTHSHSHTCTRITAPLVECDIRTGLKYEIRLRSVRHIQMRADSRYVTELTRPWALNNLSVNLVGLQAWSPFHSKKIPRFQFYAQRSSRIEFWADCCQRRHLATHEINVVACQIIRFVAWALSETSFSCFRNGVHWRAW